MVGADSFWGNSEEDQCHLGDVVENLHFCGLVRVDTRSIVFTDSSSDGVEIRCKNLDYSDFRLQISPAYRRQGLQTE